MKKRIAFLLAAIMLAGSIGGCKKEETVTDNTTALEKVDATVLPITGEDITLTLWCQNHSSRVLANYGEMEAWKELQRRTGIKIDFIHPTGAVAEQFNVMVASRDYPDIIYYHWSDSLMKYVDDGVALKLNDYVDTIMPNIRKLMESNELVKKQLPLADGTIAFFPQINALDSYNYWDAYVIRKDWLDKVGLSAPVTVDDWYTMLKAFKETDLNENGEQDEIPLSSTKAMMGDAFISAFGVLNSFQLDPATGRVAYGPLLDGYKEYLTTMNRWYSEGLIDPEYLTVDQKILDKKMLNNMVGASYLDSNNSMINYLRAKPTEGFDFTIAEFPRVEGGKNYWPRGSIENKVTRYGGVITPSCKNVVEAVKFLDYLYSPDGQVLLNWGIEGESFTVDENGKKKYTDEILNNPEGKTPVDAIAKYCNNPGFMKIYDTEAINGLDNSLEPGILEKRQESQKRAEESDKGLGIPSLAYTAEETKELNKIKTDLTTYLEEMKAKFILGKEPFENYEVFTATMRELGAERAAEIMQTAFDRYNNQ